MTDKVRKAADIVIEIERQMRLVGCWSSERPAEERLASTQPFAIDTLNFDEWLQFIFLPKIKLIIEQGGGLPIQSHITPMAEEYYKTQCDNRSSEGIVSAIQAFDTLINCA